MENSIIKTVSDYIPLVQEKFPELSESEIRKILNFGFRRYYYVNMNGCDMLIKNKDFTAFTGRLYTDAFKAYNAVKVKRKLYERILTRLKKIPWDGYYYVGLTCNEYNKLLPDLSSDRKKYITLHNKFYSRCIGELKHDKAADYIFKVKYPSYVGFRFFLKKLRVNKNDFHFVELNKLNICQVKNN